MNGITATVHSASPSASPGPDGTAKLRPGDPGTHPTALMLSHVVPIKDVRTAVLAAHLLTTRLGLPTYRLHVFGGLDRHPAYARQVARLITDLHLERNVILEGFTADAKRELRERAWVFVNSSLSEGLPLAIGEAALEGVPIVATEVGSTGLVLTDTEGGGGGGGTGEDATNPAASTDTSAGTGPRRYGEVVPPNDPMALAKAQLMVLAMVGPRWGPFCNEGREKAKAKADGCAADGDNGVILDPCAELPDTITPAHGEWLLKRMYERADDRRRLGQMSRQVVLKSFAGQRYLREHEQMYWVQWHIARMRVLAASAFRGEEVREDTSGEMILRRSFNGSVGSGGSSGGYSGTTSQSGITRFSGWSWGSQHRPMTPDDEESQRWQDFRSTTHSRRRLRKANRRQNRGAPADWMETDWTRTETNSMTQIS